MHYTSQAELAGLLMGLGFRLLKGCRKKENEPYVIGAGVGGEIAILPGEARAVAHALSGKLEEMRSRLPKGERLFVQSAFTYTLALDEFERYWMAAKRMDLSRYGFIEVTRFTHMTQLT